MQNWERILLTVEQQIFSVINWLAVLTLLQFSVYPSLKKTFGTFAFPFIFRVTPYLHHHLLVLWSSPYTCSIAVLPFLALFCYHFWYRPLLTWRISGREWRWVLLFFIFFFLMLNVRFVNPTISYAEKFMDHAFLASVMRNPVVPPLDPWFAGGP